MKITEEQLERLLHAAAATPAEPVPEMPYGFETRLLAQWRETLPNDPAAILLLLRRVMLTALALIVLAAAGAYHEMQSDPVPDSLGSEFGIADSAIGGAFEQ